MGFHWKIWFLGGGSWKTNIYLKGWGAWTVCRFKMGLGKKDGEGVFDGGLKPQCTLQYVISINLRAGQILFSIFSTQWWSLDLRTCKEHDFLKIEILLTLLV